MEFKEYKLQDICKVVDSLHKTPSYENKGVPMIRVTDLKDGYFSIPNEVKLVSQEAFSEFSKKHIPEFNDILMSRVGSYGITSIIKTREKFCLGQNTVVITDFSEEVLSEYLFYYLISSYGKELIEKNVSGSTQKTISLKSINNFNILLPEKSYQNKVINILSSFYKKIEVNNKIIANLEEQAQAIFKSWFVDFEPFQDGNFVESELGMIPEGWEVKKLKEIFEFKKGRKPKVLHEKIEEKYIPYLVKGVIDGSEIPKFTNEEKIVKIDGLDAFMLMDGANSGNIYYGFKGALGSTFSLLETRDKKYDDILYWFLKINEKIIKNQNTGSAIPHANKDFIYSMNIAVPDNCKNDKISKVLRDFRRKIIYNNEENKKLAGIRDALLPKLMSGEIDVSNIKIKGEEVKNE